MLRINIYIYTHNTHTYTRVHMYYYAGDLEKPVETGRVTKRNLGRAVVGIPEQCSKFLLVEDFLEVKGETIVVMIIVVKL